MHLPLAKPCFDKRELDAVGRVLDSGWVIQGSEVEQFEDSIAKMHGARHCIAVSSGTAALHVGYLALGVVRGDAVFVPSFAWPSAANMAVAVGARPVFVDVLPDTYNMDPVDLHRRIEQCIDKRWGTPRVVVPVHEFGLAADMDSIMKIADEFNLCVIEDAACALGATCGGKAVGSFGKLAIFSFHPRKAITTGEGGAIVTNDDALAESCRMWRNHGLVDSRSTREFRVAGFNYRMTDIQAAIGVVQMEKLPEIVKKRREMAELYLHHLAGCVNIYLPKSDSEHTWQTFMVVLRDSVDRDAVAASMAQEHIVVAQGSVAAHCSRLYGSEYGYQPSDLPTSTRLDRKGLALPLHTFMDSSHVERGSALLRAACGP